MKSRVGTLEGSLRQLLSHLCIGSERAKKDRFFEALGYGSRLSRIHLTESGLYVRRELRIAVRSEKYLYGTETVR